MWTRGTTATTPGFEFDPVCGATVEAIDSFDDSLAIDYEGHEYVFCSPKCRGMFVETPTQFAAAGFAAGRRGGSRHDNGR
ncbi:MAG TPA: hypothetical protein DCK98_13715 [Chloroflexi bacterium]|jgi:YHS domain-containing protein|nr:hypothetical protein [Chloroflexota bacterium]